MKNLKNLTNNDNHILKIASYNCYNFKANTIYIKQLIHNNDICFFIEHWLDLHEKYLFEDICNDHNIYFHSDYDKSKCKNGRPYGGTCWVVKKSVNILNFIQYNDKVSKLTIDDNNKKSISIFGVWLEYDDNSDERLANFHSNLSLMAGQMKNDRYKNNLIVGDFNSDLNRKNRFDKILVEYKKKFNLINSFDMFDQKNYFTYFKGDYKSRIDHIFLNDNLKTRIINSEIKTDSSETSDHKAITIEIYKNNCTSTKVCTTELKKLKFHKFNWKHNNYKEIFNNVVKNNLNDLSKFNLDSNASLKEGVDNNLINLKKQLLKSARETEAIINKDNSFINKKKKCKINNDTNVKKIINRINDIKYDDNLSNVLCKKRKIEFKELKRDLRRIQRYKLFNNAKAEALNLEECLNDHKDKFWTKIKKFRLKNNNSINTDKIKIEKFSEYYSKLFSHYDRPSDSQQLLIEKRVKEYYNTIKNKQKITDSFSLLDIEDIIKNLKTDKAVGVDFISNEMLKHGNCNNLISILHQIFNQMFKNGYTPNDFNTSLVTPIPKKGELTEPKDYRPISVSTTFAIIYEKLILTKINFNKDLIGPNQFGYKPNTSCKHAYFIVNETINYYNKGKSPLFIASLDATKAFDKLWRSGLFYKLKDKIDEFTWRAILSYYNESKIIVKLNGLSSETHQTTEGAKQGGVLSGFLFNFFLNEMINECLNANVGAKINKINVSVIAYCDDIVLMSPTIKHLEILLDICHRYSIKWKIEFNETKSVYISFSHTKTSINEVPKINKKEMTRVDNLIYLGLPLGDDEFKKNFFDKSMSKCERSFYSLHGLGCKPNALNPRTISFIYKQFCQSIFKNGLDMLNISNTQINSLNIRQNILIKRSIGISKFSKTKPLFQCLKIESIQQIYLTIAT